MHIYIYTLYIYTKHNILNHHYYIYENLSVCILSLSYHYLKIFIRIFLPKNHTGKNTRENTDKVEVKKQKEFQKTEP